MIYSAARVKRRKKEERKIGEVLRRINDTYIYIYISRGYRNGIRSLLFFFPLLSLLFLLHHRYLSKVLSGRQAKFHVGHTRHYSVFLFPFFFFFLSFTRRRNIVYVATSVTKASKLNLYPSGSCRFEISETWAEGAAEMKENYISRKLIRQRQNVKDLPLGY